MDAQPRRAASLAEVMVAMSLGTVILVTGVRLVHSVLGIERKSRQWLHQTTTVARLSRAFRQDVHDATACDLLLADSDRPTRLVLKLPEDVSVDYEVSRRRINRILNHDTAPSGREQFVFPDGWQVDMHVEPSPKRIALVVRPPTPRLEDTGTATRGRTAAGTSGVVRIEATVGRNHRNAALGS